MAFGAMARFTISARYFIHAVEGNLKILEALIRIGLHFHASDLQPMDRNTAPGPKMIGVATHNSLPTIIE
jgi:hypothetical protein